MLRRALNVTLLSARRIVISVVGFTIVGLGIVGMLTTGIMLGVAKKRRREIERDYRRSVYGRRLQWDPSGALRF